MEGDDYDLCARCGEPLEWEDCWQCFGEGGFDRYAEEPLEALPGEYERCTVCDGEGGYMQCPTPHRHREASYR